MLQLHGDEGPAFCAEVAPQDGRAGDQGGPGVGLRRRAGISSASTSTSICSTLARRPWRGRACAGGRGRRSTGRSLRPRRSKVPADPQRRARPPRTSPRRSAWRARTRSTAPAAPRPPRDTRTREKLRAFFRGRRTGAARARGDRGHRRQRRRSGVSATADGRPVEHRFGPYGGQFVPETLMPALAELEQAWKEAREDPEYLRGAERLLRDFGGRPTPLYRARRLSEQRGTAGVPQARGPQPHRLAQAQQRARPGRCWPSGWASGGSSPRPARASTAWRRPPCARCWDWSAWSTWAWRTCAGSGRTCSGWSCSGRRVQPVDAGARTLKEATSAAIRDWVTNVQSTHYVIGSVVGPAPYPALVRDLQRVIGDEARAQMLEREGRLPARVVACVGGGSNAMGIFAAFIPDEQVELVGRRGGRRGHRHQPARRAADRRRAPRASCTARARR